MTVDPSIRTARRGEPRQVLMVMAGTLIALVALLIAPGSARAEEVDRPDGTLSVQQRIDEAMQARPGGIQFSATEISWDDGAVVLTVDGGVGPHAIGSCATGAFCAWDGANLTGSKLSFTSCGTHSTAGLSVVRSIANARSSGSVKAKNASGTVLVTLKRRIIDGQRTIRCEKPHLLAAIAPSGVSAGAATAPT